MMEIAKVTSKGQITIPVDVRRKLGIQEGDKILFVCDRDRIFIMNSSIDAWQKAQASFIDEAEHAGFKDEQDVVSMVKEIRKERWEEA